MDEVDSMHESVMLSLETGVRFVMFTSENYFLDMVAYSLCSPFIKTSDRKNISLNQIDLENKVFVIDERKIPLALILRD